jgi:hypothetical protein
MVDFAEILHILWGVNSSTLHETTLDMQILYPVKNTYMGFQDYRKLWNHLLTVTSTVWKLEMLDKAFGSRA